MAQGDRRAHRPCRSVVLQEVGRCWSNKRCAKFIIFKPEEKATLIRKLAWNNINVSYFTVLWPVVVMNKKLSCRKIELC